MIFLAKKTHKDLEPLRLRVESNMANNYKDAAQEAFREFEKKARELDEMGKLTEKQRENYRHIADSLRIRLKNFTHKDQTPYWT